jgi:hypothetical protein
MPRQLRRTAGAVLGTAAGTVLVLAGLVMLVTPGPGLVSIAAGMAVLSRHHAALARLRGRAADGLRRTRGTSPGADPVGPEPIGPGSA